MLDRAEVICVGDEHSGSTTGLMPLEGVILKDGNPILPNPIQEEVARFWAEFWERRKKSKWPKAVVRMGDGIDSLHHGSTQVWGTSGLHLDTLTQLYTPVRKMAKYAFSVNGTPVHVGDEGEADYALAQRLLFDKVGGRYSNYHARLTIAGVVFDVAHKGPSAGIYEQHRGNSLRNYAKSIIFTALRNHEVPPDVIVRAHVHRKAHETVHVEDWKTEAFITPSWQAKTEYAHHVTSVEHLADVGGLVLIVEKGRVVDNYFDCMTYDDTPEVHV